MKYLNTVLLQKVLTLSVVVLSQGYFIYIFSLHQEWFDNMRLSYITNTYFPSYAYRLHAMLPNQATKNLAAAAGALIESTKKNSVVGLGATTTTRSIPILNYHGIVEKVNEGADGYNILTSDFYDQMKALKENGYTTISYGEFEQFARGEVLLPQKSILITFDDGRKDSYYPVDPILKAFGFQATIFVLPKYSLLENDNGYYLSKRELTNMIKSERWSIQSHSLNDHTYYPVDASGKPGNYYSNKLWLESEGRLETEDEFKQRVLNDLQSSKEILESELGIKVSGIAYPFGQYGQNSVNYPEAVTLVPELMTKVYHYGFYQTDPSKGFSYYTPTGQDYLVQRIEIRPDWKGEELLEVLEMGHEKNLPFADDFEKYHGWIKWWGNYSIDGSMVLNTSEFNDETFVVLDGAQRWDNMAYTVSTNSVNGGDLLSLIVNLSDQDNYSACAFESDQVTIETRENGQQKKFLTAPYMHQRGEARYTTTISQGKISCIVNDIEIVSYHLPKYESGTIGLKFTSDKDTARVGIKNVAVHEL